MKGKEDMNPPPVVAVLLLLLYSCSGQQLSPLEVAGLLLDRNYVLQQIDCVLDKGQCDTVGYQLKRAIPEVLMRGCRSCTPEQSSNARIVINFIKQNYPNEWSQIENRFSPGRFRY